ncbi:hypothetical protein JZ751_018739 [Albula glossodonta]|uniref:Secreted protein n=1 Tax=Albula glossodonta TaxID=121402 RepID=A0A8T2NMT2_9TELE|nr:hypothetical protein JZ751_018739 [Albula glossodonta]
MVVLAMLCSCLPGLKLLTSLPSPSVYSAITQMMRGVSGGKRDGGVALKAFIKKCGAPSAYQLPTRSPLCRRIPSILSTGEQTQSTNMDGEEA